MLKTNYCEGHVYIRGKVGKQLENLLIDTGASRSLIDLDFLKMSVPDVIIIQEQKYTLKGISGGKIDNRGVVKALKIWIENCEMSLDFIVIANLNEKVILGIDFIDRTKASLDYENHVIFNKQFRTNLLKLENNPQYYYSVCTMTAVAVKSELDVKCVVTGGGEFEPNSYTYYPDPELWQHGKHLQANGCEVKLLNKEIYARIYNPNTSPILLPKNTCLGKLVPIKKINSYAIGNEHNYERNKMKIKALDIESNSNLTTEQKNQLKKLLHVFLDIFAIDRSELGVCNILEHEIKTTTDEPVRSKFRKIPLHLLKDVETEVSDLLANNIIEPSESAYSSPAMVIKRNNKTRLILDYRNLNKVIERSQNPVPAAVTILSQLGNDNRYFSNFDMKDGYFQVKLTDETKHKTAFSVPLIGHFQFIRVPLGISSAPAMFQGLTDRLLENISSSVALGYLDDIISTSATFEQGLTNLRKLFKRFREANLKLNPFKTKLMCQKIKFLGVWISEAGISPDEDKINAIREMSQPRTKRQCQSFLGCVNFFRAHVKNLACTIKPISDTLAGKKFCWTAEAGDAFEKTKLLLTSAEILIFPDTDKTMHIFTDSSEYALGGSIMQLTDTEYRPICYGSRVLGPTERNYPTIKKELLALKHFTKLWYYYLMGKKFVAHVDARALTGKNFLNTTNCSTMLRWLMELTEFDFEIVYQKGTSNVVADALSRLPRTSDQFYNWYKTELNPDKPRQAMINTVKVSETLSDLVKLQGDDSTLQLVAQWLKASCKPDKIPNTDRADLKQYHEKFDQLSLDTQGRIIYEYFSQKTQKSRKLICVPEVLKKEILYLNHDHATAGHLSYKKCLERILQKFYWPTIRKDTEHYTRLCEVCFRTNLKYAKKPKVPMTIFTANLPGEFLCCDLIGPLTPSNGKKWIFTMTDKFSRYSRAVALSNSKAETLARALLDEWIANEGLFKVLLTDQGPNLTTSAVMLELYKVLQIDKRQTTPYRPSTNGLVERFNRSIINIVKKYVQEFPKNWSYKLNLACLAHNTAYSESTQLTPFELMRGRSCLLPHDLVFDTHTSTFYRDQQHYHAKIYFEIREIWDLARKNNLKYAIQTKIRHDGKSKQCFEYKPGNLVLVWKPIKEENYRKFRNNFIGPLKVLAKLSDYTYKLVNPKNGKISVENYESMRYYNVKLRKNNKSAPEICPKSKNRIPFNSEDSSDEIVPDSGLIMEEEVTSYSPNPEVINVTLKPGIDTAGQGVDDIATGIALNEGTGVNSSGQNCNQAGIDREPASTSDRNRSEKIKISGGRDADIPPELLTDSDSDDENNNGRPKRSSKQIDRLQLTHGGQKY